jgi:hypothetical protein
MSVGGQMRLKSEDRVAEFEVNAALRLTAHRNDDALCISVCDLRIGSMRASDRRYRYTLSSRDFVHDVSPPCDGALPANRHHSRLQ